MDSNSGDRADRTRRPGRIRVGYWGVATLLIVVVIVQAVLTYLLKKPLEEVLHGTEHAFRNTPRYSAPG